jgi:hypothetical protein
MLRAEPGDASRLLCMIHNLILIYTLTAPPKTKTDLRAISEAIPSLPQPVSAYILHTFAQPVNQFT